MTFNPSEMIRAYREGLGFRENDVLKPKDGVKDISTTTFGVIEGTVVVVEQCPLAPHKYTVVGECENPRTPSDRFVKFEIDGHNWKKIGRA